MKVCKNILLHAHTKFQALFKQLWRAYFHWVLLLFTSGWNSCLFLLSNLCFLREWEEKQSPGVCCAHFSRAIVSVWTLISWGFQAAGKNWWQLLLPISSWRAELKLAGTLVAVHCYSLGKWEEKNKATLVYVIFETREV